MILEYDPAMPGAQEQLTAIENVRKVLDPVTADVVSLRLAARFITHKQWELALSEFDKVDADNLAITSDRIYCRHYLEQEHGVAVPANADMPK